MRLKTPWLVSISHGIGRAINTRRLTRADLVTRDGVRFIDATAPGGRDTRRFCAGDRVRVRCDANDFMGVIERTSCVQGARFMVIRVVE